MNTTDDKIKIYEISGGVCAPEGFRAGGIHCGIRRNKNKKDLAMIVSDVLCDVAAVYTQNKVKGAPISVTKENISNGKAQAVICNSGNANTCAPDGESLARKTCVLTAKHLSIAPEDIIICSTGVIGQQLFLEPFTRGIPRLVDVIAYDGSEDAAEAIMTTDTITKSIAVEFEIDGIKCRIGGIAKGSGMINPDMATVLSFITSDVSIDSTILQQVLNEDVKGSFNQICVDGDTSTNDTVAIMANGLAGNPTITEDSSSLRVFRRALSHVTEYLAQQLARDGEGANKLIECLVYGAPDTYTARSISKTVISSNLLKAAVFGSDANWGRVLCAVGYAPGDFSTGHIDVHMKSAAGSVMVCEGSSHKKYSERVASRILKEPKVTIEIDLKQGEASGKAWGCDLTYDYVRINGDYRS